MITFEQINERNREFWAVQAGLLLKRVSDPLLYEVALAGLDLEQRQRLPIYWRRNLETILEDAEGLRPRLHDLFRDEFSRKGGSSRKADALAKLMARLVARDPSITASALLRHLKGDGDFTVNDEEIAFRASNGKEKSAPITGLKHRLSRIKKLTKSR